MMVTGESRIRPRGGPTPVTSPTYRPSDDPPEQIQDLLPKNGQRGGQWKDHRLLTDGIVRALCNGGRWRDLPAAFGPWQTAYGRSRGWARRGLWDRILRRPQARKPHSGDSGWALSCIDGPGARAPRAAARAPETSRRRRAG